jgi:hypothetical protein
MEAEASSEFEYHLKPTGPGSEYLQDFYIPVDSIGEVVIGRKSIQQCEDNKYYKFISRSHIAMYVQNKELFIRSTAQGGCVSVNSIVLNESESIKLSETDIISLLHQKNYFNYQIEQVPMRIKSVTNTRREKIETPVENKLSLQSRKRSIDGYFQRFDNDNTPAKTPNNSLKESVEDTDCNAASGGRDAPFAITAIQNTLECTICLQIMALCYSVVPCGHNFCYTCILDWLNQHKTCPTCNAVAANVIPSRALDDIISCVITKKDSSDAVTTDFNKRYQAGTNILKLGKHLKFSSDAPKSAAKKNKVSSYFVDLS